MEIDNRFKIHFEEIENHLNSRHRAHDDDYNMEENNPEVAFIKPRDHQVTIRYNHPKTN